MPKIVSQTKRVSDLTVSEKSTMFGLLSMEFLGATYIAFANDLKEKDSVALLRDGSISGEIVGFSTLMVLDLPIPGRKVKAVFSGDTTVLPEFRTSRGMGLEVGSYFTKTMKEFPSFEIYYILISKGWRTYKILPFFFKDFSPKHDKPTPVLDKEVMDVFGRSKYPENYSEANGTIMFMGETQRLVPGSVDAIPPCNPDDHIQFFLKRNPTYLSGTELVCVGKVEVQNFATPLLRLLKAFK